ncbi:hypothetical protein MMC29_007929 [Sticta canariensis]|nr:hypothetical protein [Sticta canariensis]
MSGSKLDQIVKGAPPPGTSLPNIVSRSSSPSPALGNADLRPSRPGTPLPPSDPLATLPSSPPQIYLNLLILEASLRSQYLALRARRRQHTFFLLVLTGWITCFFYALFLRPREDGSGMGGSVYWVVEMAEKVALMGGVVTGILMWGTGQWDRGVRWPRRWVGVANRGLRNVNAKIVVIKGSWWREALSLLYFLFPYTSFFLSRGSSLHYLDPVVEENGDLNDQYKLENDEILTIDEDLSPGGDYIKLLLMPKPFSADFRENWELYRIEYWEKENERRADLRRQFKERRREYAKEQGGWLWWAGWRGWNGEKDKDRSSVDAEKNHEQRLERDPKRRRSFTRSTSHSRTTSRSSTPASLDIDERPSSARKRRGSSNASGSERRRKTKSSASVENVPNSRLTQMETSLGPDSGNNYSYISQSQRSAPSVSAISMKATSTSQYFDS